MPGSSEIFKPEIVCILGMHRSGTSLLTRMLNLIGVYLGPEQLLLPPNFANPRGYWEHGEIVSLNDEILRRLGGSWDEPPALPPGWENAPTIDDLKQRGRRLIQDSFANVDTWGWKDPRSCLTLPFWQKLLPEMRYIVCLRNPLDVAGSLEYRNGFAAEKSSQLWLTYVNSALEHTHGRSRLVIFYEDLIDDCLRQLQLLADFLGKPERAKAVDVQEAVQEFMEKELRHYHTSTVQATASPKIAVHAKALYIAQRISVSFGCRESNGREGSDHEIEKALDILSQYAIRASGQANPLIEHLAELDHQLAENGNTVRLLQTQLLGQGKEKTAISARLTESEQALETQLVERNAIVEALSTQLVAKDGIVEALSTQLVAKDGIVEELSTQLVVKNGIVEELSTQLVAKNGIVEELSTQLVAKDGIVQELSTQLVAKDGIVQELSTQLAEQTRAQQFQAETAEEPVRVLSAQLLDTETQLLKIKETLGWRLLSRYGRIKHRYFLPIYRLFG